MLGCKKLRMHLVIDTHLTRINLEYFDKIILSKYFIYLKSQIKLYESTPD